MVIGDSSNSVTSPTRALASPRRPHATSSKSKAEPVLSRCYWGILDERLMFWYLDPNLKASLGSTSESLIGTSLYEWIHPEELTSCKTDYEAFLQSRTLFGTVTRCRYSTISKMRKQLGGEGENHQRDDDYLPIKIVSSWISDHAILCFFHGVLDKDEAADNDPVNVSDWSNWCGPRAGEDYFTSGEIESLLDALKRIHEDVSPPNQARVPPVVHPPRHVFQLLDSKDASIVVSFPPPDSTKVNSEGAEEKYLPEEYAKLAKDVWERPKERNDEATTSCTRRYRSKHPVMKDGVLTSIDSVVIRYGSLSFSCFQTGGIFGGVGMRSSPVAGMKRRADDGDDGEGGKKRKSDASLWAGGEPGSVPPPPGGWQHPDPRFAFSMLPPANGNSYVVYGHPNHYPYPTYGPDGVSYPFSMPAATTGGASTIPPGGAAHGRQHDPNKTCTSCGTSNSPEWRKGPNGIKSLCNACGLRYARSQARKQKKETAEAAAAAGTPLPSPTPKKSKAGSAATVSGSTADAPTASTGIPPFQNSATQPYYQALTGPGQKSPVTTQAGVNPPPGAAATTSGGAATAGTEGQTDYTYGVYNYTGYGQDPNAEWR